MAGTCAFELGSGGSTLVRGGLRTVQGGLEVALVAAEVNEAQHAGGPRRHLRRR